MLAYTYLHVSCLDLLPLEKYSSFLNNIDYSQVQIPAFLGNQIYRGGFFSKEELYLKLFIKQTS